MEAIHVEPEVSPVIKVLCVDDHRLMREGIVRIIGFDEGVQVVAEGGTGEEAVERFLQHRPDVTLMDLQLRGMNGLQAIRTIRSLQPDARIVVLTMYEGDETIYDALEAGAVGYLLKDSVPGDLIRVIREVHAGLRHRTAAVRVERVDQHHTGFFRQRHPRDEVSGGAPPLATTTGADGISRVLRTC